MYNVDDADFGAESKQIGPTLGHVQPQDQA